MGQGLTDTYEMLNHKKYPNHYRFYIEENKEIEIEEMKSSQK